LICVFRVAFAVQYERYGGKKQACLCGAPNCAKFLGGKAKPLELDGIAAVDGAATAAAAAAAEAERVMSVDFDPAADSRSPPGEEDAIATSAKRVSDTRNTAPSDCRACLWL
jgi:hypothetical protein